MNTSPRKRELSPAARKRVREKLAELLGVDVDKIPEDVENFNLADIGFDSLDTVELVMELEEELGIDFDDDDDDTGSPPLSVA